jgi:hypothetical protein
MVAGTTDTYTDTNIHNLNKLLEKLDSMRSEGVPAPDRLRFIQENSQTLFVKDYQFDWDRAYDGAALPFLERQKKLEELKKDWKALQASWTTSPLSSQWKNLGEELLRQLNSILSEAQGEESSREIEELSSLWDTSPDITEVYDDCVLTAWGASEPHSRIRARESKKKARERELFDELKQVVADAKVEARPPAEQDADFQEVWKLWKDGSVSIEDLKKMNKEAVAHLAAVAEEVQEIKEAQETLPPPADLPEKASDLVQKESLEAERISRTVVDDGAAADHLTRKLEHQGFERKEYPVKMEEEEISPEPVPYELPKVSSPPVTEGEVRKVRDPLGQPSKKTAKPGALLVAKTWTEALNEATCEVWNFGGAGTSLYRRQGGVECESLVWRFGSDQFVRSINEVHWSVRLDILEDGEERQVFMMINSPNSKRQWHEEKLTQEGLEKLHADPKPFIEKVLAS